MGGAERRPRARGSRSSEHCGSTFPSAETCRTFGRTMRCSSAARCPALSLAQVSTRRCRRRVHPLVTRAESSQRAAESSLETMQSVFIVGESDRRRAIDLTWQECSSKRNILINKVPKSQPTPDLLVISHYITPTP